jgi:hypothetical protein
LLQLDFRNRRAPNLVNIAITGVVVAGLSNEGGQGANRTAIILGFRTLLPKPFDVPVLALPW